METAFCWRRAGFTDYPCGIFGIFRTSANNPTPQAHRHTPTSPSLSLLLAPITFHPGDYLTALVPAFEMVDDHSRGFSGVGPGLLTGRQITTIRPANLPSSIFNFRLQHKDFGNLLAKKQAMALFS